MAQRWAPSAGVYSFFARDLPDASAIETEQVEFETVRIFDRTGQHLLYESFDPRPFRGDRTYLPLDEMTPVGYQRDRGAGGSQLLGEPRR